MVLTFRVLAHRAEAHTGCRSALDNVTMESVTVANAGLIYRDGLRPLRWLFFLFASHKLKFTVLFLDPLDELLYDEIKIVVVLFEVFDGKTQVRSEPLLITDDLV